MLYIHQTVTLLLALVTLQAFLNIPDLERLSQPWKRCCCHKYTLSIIKLEVPRFFFRGWASLLSCALKSFIPTLAFSTVCLLAASYPVSQRPIHRGFMTACMMRSTLDNYNISTMV